MRHYLILVRREIRALLIAPGSWAASVLFLLVMGSLYFLIIELYSDTPHDAPPMEVFFQWFWIPVFFLVPLLTMRSIAEERRLGTLESLMTTPITPGALILAKFTAAYLFYLGLWALTLAFPFLTQFSLGRADIGPSLLDSGVLIGGNLFIALSGLLFIAVGIFSSALTRSQLVAGLLTFSILFIIIVGLPALQDQLTDTEAWLSRPLEYLQVFNHLQDFARGVIDTRPFFYYGSLTALVLGMATLVVEART